MKIIIILHVYLFFRQLIQKAFPIILTVFFKQKLKNSKKISFCIVSKAESSCELKFKKKKE